MSYDILHVAVLFICLSVAAQYMIQQNTGIWTFQAMNKKCKCIAAVPSEYEENYLIIHLSVMLLLFYSICEFIGSI